MGEDTDSTRTTDALFQIFSDSNVVIIIWFLAVYFIIYLLLNIFRGKDGVKSSISRWIDVVALLCLLVYLGFTFFDKSDDEKKRMISATYNVFKSYLDSPLSLISVSFFIFTLYIVIYVLEIPMDSFGKPITISIIENCAWILLILVLLSVFLRYIAGVSFTEFLDNVGDYFKEKADEATSSKNKKDDNNDGDKNDGDKNDGDKNDGDKKDGDKKDGDNKKDGDKKNNDNDDDDKKTQTKVTASPSLDEVFNVGNNMFTYDDAKTVCASYGARLATYDEVEKTYNSGGEWCNYGWSDGQAAYFPTQKATWEKLQQSEYTKHSCGRPGVNGGYIENENVRFGANCFGKKPAPSSSELSALSNGLNIPKTPEDAILEKKISFWKANRDKLLKINSYNNNKWSMY